MQSKQSAKYSKGQRVWWIATEPLTLLSGIVKDIYFDPKIMYVIANSPYVLDEWEIEASEFVARKKAAKKIKVEFIKQ